MFMVQRKERVPLGTPKHFDDVPAGANEQGFELLDDLTITANRTVESL